jgi:diadenosine tetraphosphate (Ap4A) HIT family hydrolase
LSVFIPNHEFLVYETEHWRVNQRIDSPLPGYLMVGAKDPKAVDLTQLSEVALSEMGAVLAMATGALQRLFKPEHLHICRFGHDNGHTVHFHIIPIYKWVIEAYRRASRDGGTHVQYPDFIDGSALTLFVTEEFGRGRAPCEIIEPSIGAVIQVLRDELNPGSHPNATMQPKSDPPAQALLRFSSRQTTPKVSS